MEIVRAFLLYFPTHSAGETAYFEVALNSQPDSMMWLKNNKPISGEMTSRIQTSNIENEFKLTITQVKKEDAGLYIAVANTSQGQISCSAQLLVHER